MGANDDDEDFWGDLLGYIRHQRLIPVVGPDLTVVKVDDVEQTLSTLIGQQLAERNKLTVSPGMTMGEAVALFLRTPDGREKAKPRLYRQIDEIIEELHPEPGDPLKNLAAVTDLRLFVNTTPDRMLAQALNTVRFQGRSATREVPISWDLTTGEQPVNDLPASKTDTVVVNLFGRASSAHEYAIHEEDRLEWLHKLLSKEVVLPDWVAERLRDTPMLFIGCEIPDWIGRFLLRMSSRARLSDEKKQFFFVGSPTSNEPPLSSFFETYFRKTQVQHLKKTTTPTEFVAELRERWQSQATSPTAVDAASYPAPDVPMIFISYMWEDADAAEQLASEIEDGGGVVWIDKRRTRPGHSRILGGDEYEVIAKAAIGRAHLFIAVISANTEKVDRGTVYQEWGEAVRQSESIIRRRFIVPVIVDANYTGDPQHLKNIKKEFKPLDFSRAPGGVPDADMRAMLKAEIREMRRTGPA